MNQQEIEKKLEALKKTLYAFKQTPFEWNPQVTFEQVIEKLSELEDEITKTTRPRRFRVLDYQIVNRFGDDDAIMRAGFRWDSGEWTLTLGPNDVVNDDYIALDRTCGWYRYYEWIQLSDVEEIYP